MIDLLFGRKTKLPAALALKNKRKKNLASRYVHGPQIRKGRMDTIRN